MGPPRHSHRNGIFGVLHQSKATGNIKLLSAKNIDNRIVKSKRKLGPIVIQDLIIKIVIKPSTY